MNRRAVYFSLSLALISLVIIPAAKAQLEIKMLNHQKIESARVMEDSAEVEIPLDTLSLPFWDDFSQATSRIPDSRRWYDSEDVFINFSLAINPPTLGVASLDGARGDGRPYSNNVNNIGDADVFTSMAIDLEEVPANLVSGLFFSFAWQAGGFSEIPDTEDSLVLEFYTNEGRWERIWGISGDENMNRSIFTTQVLPVQQPRFLHSGFQFRFRNVARLSGRFDNWNLDYIYLNVGRNANQVNFPDRAVSRKPDSPFAPYHSVPYSRAMDELASLADTSRFTLSNLSTQDNFIEYSLSLRNEADQSSIASMASVVSALLQTRSFRIFDVPLSPSTVNLPALAEDSIQMGVHVSLITPDNIQPNTTGFVGSRPSDVIDFRLNDRATTMIELNNFYSYDDGTAEFAIGINQNGGRLAYEYIVPGGTVLTHIDLYFPPLGEGLQDINPGVLFVWDKLLDALPDEDEDGIISFLPILLQGSEDRNQFVRFELENPVAVEDTFYIGYRQDVNRFVPLGWDTDTNSRERIYFNVSGSWEQADETFSGSMMMRPVINDDIVLSVAENLPKTLTIYPNPGRGEVRFSNAVDQVLVFDSRGKLVLDKQSDAMSRISSVDLSNFSKGIYLLKIKTETGFQTKKYILEK
ncbi:MAG: T9SS type A sorting domain-containing protein [Cyclobacteriaceae bacterium]|nr:T9SS type A sorting domain-containing protein [Cyclobacteriaceae bacterium]MCH8517149.1 T9SS type A sorting domain-containing protein [Cyclobacteriaceae bacterium]